MITCKLEKEYFILGILLLILVAIGIYFDFKIAYIILIFILLHISTTPYRIDLFEDNRIKVHFIFTTKNYNVNDVEVIKTGNFRNSIVTTNGSFYIDHLLANYKTVSQEIQRRKNVKMDSVYELSGRNDRRKKSGSKKENEIVSNSRLIIIIVAIVILSVFTLIYFVSMVQEIKPPTY